MASKPNEPDEPYIRVIPNNKNPVENAPIKKYFNAASFDAKSFFLIPARMYELTDMISIPINNIVQLLYDTITTIPTRANNIKA